MKKKSFTGLVVLMGFSLLGIIMVQFFWMNNAIEVRKEKFNATVYDALNAAVQRAQREQAANYYIQQFFPSQRRTANLVDSSTVISTPHFPLASKQQRFSPEDILANKSSQASPLNRGHFEAHIEFQNNGKSQQ